MLLIYFTFYFIVCIAIIFMMINMLLPQVQIWESLKEGFKKHYSRTVAILCMAGILICIICYYLAINP